MDKNEPRILLVDDEKDIIEFLTYNLVKEGYKVESAFNGKEAIVKAVSFKPHLILLDVMMPEMDGVDTCDQMRKIPDLDKTVIAFLTARGEDYSQIAGFEAGADDYITKPVRPKVLISRIKALLKRYGQHEHVADKLVGSQTITHNDITIDKDRYIVIQNGHELELPRKEFELLSLLISKPEKVFTRNEIFHQVWGDDVIVGDRTIDVHIRKLREKIGEDKIHTIKGVGYKFDG